MPSSRFTVPARNPRTLCCCQSVACIISSMLAPSDWLSRVSTRSCLVTRSTFGSSAFLSVLAAATRSAFDSTDRVGFLALAAGDVTLRRDAVFDWALPFLGAGLFVFRGFIGMVDIVWAPSVRGAAIDARTTQSPAHREASPECFTGHVHRPAPIAMRPLRQKSSRLFAACQQYRARQKRALALERLDLSGRFFIWLGRSAGARRSSDCQATDHAGGRSLRSHQSSGNRTRPFPRVGLNPDRRRENRSLLPRRRVRSTLYRCHPPPLPTGNR